VRRKSRAGIASRRALFGAKLATLAVISGATATGVSVLAVAYLAAVGSSAPTRTTDRTELASHRAPVLSIPTVGTTLEESPAPITERRYGSILVVDIAPDVSSLDDELDRQRTLADVSGERLLLWLVVPECKPCAAVQAALPSGELQRALAKSRIVRLSAVDFGAELARVGLPMDAFPGFALLGPNGFATDYLHGGEWDADIPQNIAPVLKSFVDGTYTQRRSPWRGGPHEDETAI
jgi:hypothetical protein